MLVLVIEPLREGPSHQPPLLVAHRPDDSDEIALRRLEVGGVLHGPAALRRVHGGMVRRSTGPGRRGVTPAMEL